MADNKEEILIEVNFTDNKTLERMAAIRQEMLDLKTANAAINEEIKKSGEVTTMQSTALLKNGAAYKELNRELKFYERQAQAEAVVNKDLGDSTNALRVKLRGLQQQYDALSEDQKFSEQGLKLKGILNDTTTAIKDAEEATQRYGRNVGNYTNSIKAAGVAGDGFAGSVMGIINNAADFGGAMGAGAQGILGMVKAAKVFIATPIGATLTIISGVITAIVSVMGKMKDAFLRSETNADKLAVALGGLSGIGKGVLKALEPVAQFLGDTFIKAVEKVTDALVWLGVADGDMVKANRELAKSQRELAKEQREAEKIQLQYQRAAEKQRQIRDDESRSIEERIAANKELGRILDEQTTKELAIANKAVETAKKRIEVEGETESALDALAEAETRVADIEERIDGQRSEQLVNINALNKELREQQNLALQAATAWANAQAVAAEAVAAMGATGLKKPDLIHTAKVERSGYGADEEEAEDVTKVFLDEIALKLEYEKMGYDQEAQLRHDALVYEYNQRRAAGENLANLDYEFAQREQQIAAETRDKKIAAGVATAKGLITSMRNLAEVSGASAEFQKVLAVAEVAINTGAAVAAGIADAMAVPFPANLAAIATTLAAVTSGILQAKQAIASANVPKPAFATGGLVTGAGTGTSDSIDAKLSNGEAVINARSTAAFAPLLSAINVAGGGVPFAATTKLKQQQALADTFAQMVASTPIYVAVTDINEGQARVANIIENSNY